MSGEGKTMITNALVQARQLYEDTDGVLVCDKYGYVEYLLSLIHI